MELENLKLFVKLADSARKHYMGSTGKTDRTWYETHGVEPETIDYLIKHHYASQQPGKSLWIAFENKYHKEKTISNLVRAIELAEEKKKEEEMKQKQGYMKNDK